MKRNLGWLLGLLLAVACLTALRQPPRPQPSRPPVPSQTPPAAPGSPAPEIFYQEQTANGEQFTFAITGSPSQWRYRARWTVRMRAIEDARSLENGEVAALAAALERLSHNPIPPRPVLDTLGSWRQQPGTESVTFTGRTTVGIPREISLNAKSNPLLWKALRKELTGTFLSAEQNQLRKELHARFGH